MTGFQAVQATLGTAEVPETHASSTGVWFALHAPNGDLLNSQRVALPANPADGVSAVFSTPDAAPGYTIKATPVDDGNVATYDTFTTAPFTPTPNKEIVVVTGIALA